MSTIAVRLPSRWWWAPIAASHVEPSSSSPSERKLKTRDGGVLVPQPEGHADGDGQAVAEGAAGDFHARGVGGHPGHREAGVVGAVGFQFATGMMPASASAA